MSWVSPQPDPRPGPTDGDTLKVVSWWYNDERDEGALHDKLALKVDPWCPTWTFYRGARSDNSKDNQQRVYIAQPAASADWRFTLCGRDVRGRAP
ncbi:MAG: hypothetical protein JXX28_01950 [Deltaproteobacteria bacterium]|nr:hypothetical protein [Deltaproteobacteria bacterium]